MVKRLIVTLVVFTVVFTGTNISAYAIDSNDIKNNIEQAGEYIDKASEIYNTVDKIKDETLDKTNITEEDLQEGIDAITAVAKDENILDKVKIFFESVIDFVKSIFNRTDDVLLEENKTEDMISEEEETNDVQSSIVTEKDENISKDDIKINEHIIINAQENNNNTTNISGGKGDIHEEITIYADDSNEQSNHSSANKEEHETVHYNFENTPKRGYNGIESPAVPETNLKLELND